jgi:hypothetical protein
MTEVGGNTLVRTRESGRQGLDSLVDTPPKKDDKNAGFGALHYPDWLGWTAVASFIALFTGFFAAMLLPGVVTGLVFTAGLFGIFLTRQLARRNRIAWFSERTT